MLFLNPEHLPNHMRAFKSDLCPGLSPTTLMYLVWCEPDRCYLLSFSGDPTVCPVLCIPQSPPQKEHCLSPFNTVRGSQCGETVLSPGDIWKSLDTFLIVHLVEVGGERYRHLEGRGQGCC